MTETPTEQGGGTMALIQQIGFILFIAVKCGYLAIVIIIALYVHFIKHGKFNYLSAIFLIQLTSITLMTIYELFFH